MADSEAQAQATGLLDRPISTVSQDALGRPEFVRRLSQALVNASTQKSTGLVIGITGPWGSGKSSILNLLQENIKASYPSAVVLRFDPWIVSGRVDLVTEFFRELIRAINFEGGSKKKLKAISKTLDDYGSHLSPIGNLWVPGLGTIIGGVLKFFRRLLSPDEPLPVLRSRLAQQLAGLSIPIVVMIDEVDRVEDSEVRTIAQLVRSVADFPNISYVLAYDSERVIQALGSDAPEDQREERGRGYLEKIVQLQIPLPVIFADEIERLILAELSIMAQDGGLPKNFKEIDRFNDLIQTLIIEVTLTPRDVKRMMGVYRSLMGMLKGEVDWIDLLAYSSLIIKAPRTIEQMRRDPSLFLGDPITPTSIRQFNKLNALKPEERREWIIPKSENNDAVAEILSFLFPWLADLHIRQQKHPDGLSSRRPLLTTLRLGLMPGAYSRSFIEALVKKTSSQVAMTIKQSYDEDKIDGLIDRLDDLYNGLSDINHISFWNGVGQFAEKPDDDWLSSYQPMNSVIRKFANVLESAVKKDAALRPVARAVFKNLQDGGEDELTAIWLRSHFFTFGIFGREKRGGEDWFFSALDIEKIAREMCTVWRNEHLQGTLIPLRWDLQPVFSMLDTGFWDDACRRELENALKQDNAVDGFSLMLFGGAYTTDRETIAKICDLDFYLARARTRLTSKSVHETVRVALNKALGNWN